MGGPSCEVHCSALLLQPAVPCKLPTTLQAQLKYRLPLEAFQDYSTLTSSSPFPFALLGRL